MKQTAVEWLEKQFDKYTSGGVNVPNNKIFKLTEKAKQIEEQRIKDAIMYALDEDGHTGEWKIKFANDYIKNLKQ